MVLINVMSERYTPSFMRNNNNSIIYNKLKLRVKNWFRNDQLINTIVRLCTTVHSAVHVINHCNTISRIEVWNDQLELFLKTESKKG